MQTAITRNGLWLERLAMFDSCFVAAGVKKTLRNVAETYQI
jgi:hypothetical protein